MKVGDIIDRIYQEKDYSMNTLQDHCGVFLDRFYYLAKEDELAQEPTRYKDVPQWIYAYIAGMAEMLARKYYYKSPAWTRDPFYYSPKPVFQFNAQDEYKLVLMVTSPQEFISHNIFMEPNVLERA